MQAYVFAIEEFSVYDGPGIRTTVFLKGCPLRCSWCHNPEGQNFANEVMKAQSGCLGCGACTKATGRVTEDSIRLCPNRLLRMAARAYTPQTLVEQLAGNFPILALSGGGITFSGGEPLAQPEFLIQCLQLLQGRVHTAVQTCGYCKSADFAAVLPLADHFLFDLKLADSALHKRYTGVDNRQILENFAALCRSGKPFTVRTPLIPGVTDTEENLLAIGHILKKHGVDRIELLPYNQAAGSKYAAIGRRYQPDFDPEQPVNTDFTGFAQLGITATLL